MANRPAKNISSLDSQTIVPTLTMLGRVSECTLLDWKPGAAAVEVTQALWPADTARSRWGWRVSICSTRPARWEFRARIRSPGEPGSRQRDGPRLQQFR